MRAGIICSVFRMSQRWFGGVRFFFLVCGLVVEVDELNAKESQEISLWPGLKNSQITVRCIIECE